MADQNIISREHENEQETSGIGSDAEFDPRMLTPYSDLKLPPLAPNLQRLYRAAMDGKWKTAKAIIDKDQNAKTRKISPLGSTALLVAASCGRSEFVVELVKLLTEQDLEIRDQLGRTALHHVALASSVKAAKAMVEKNPRLPQLGDMDLQTPLLYAARWRRTSKTKEMLDYLHQVTKDEPPCHAFTSDSASNLIVAITASGSYDIALCILGRYPKLAYSKNDKGKSILHVLAMQPSAFSSVSDRSAYFWMCKRFGIKRGHLHAVKLVKFICEELQKRSITFIQDFFIPKNDIAILHLATEHGVFELVQMCLTYFPNLIWYANNKKRLLLHAAIEYRRVYIFNYMINLIGENTKAYVELHADEEGNNALHLAAKLAPSPQFQSVLGPAFQMRLEVQWFKAVEALVDYESRTEKNIKEQTPQELFIEEHQKLQNDAKEWMKNASNSCMVVAALIATVAFAAMITVPGGNDNGKGIPIFSSKKLFNAFIISNALSMIFSANSLLMFLLIQSSGYADEDFIIFPARLYNGQLFLVVAVATMMISFGTAMGLSPQKRINWAYIPITVATCYPAIIFYFSQLNLMNDTLVFRSGPGIFQRSWHLDKFANRQLAHDIP